MEEKYDIYICYSRKDNEVATDICHFLDQQGLSYWIDRRNIESGDDYAQSIVNAINSSRLFMFIISESSGKSKFCMNELAVALQHKKQVFPLYTDHTPFSDELSFLIGNLSWVDYSDKYRWQRDLLQYFHNSTDKEFSTTPNEEFKDSISVSKTTSWSSVRIGEEEKDAKTKLMKKVGFLAWKPTLIAIFSKKF